MYDIVDCKDSSVSWRRMTGNCGIAYTKPGKIPNRFAKKKAGILGFACHQMKAG
jgi:hypothetical protein